LKVALITDQHFGARNDLPQVLDHYEKFYETIFFPTLVSEKITTLLILGDTFDRRKYVNFYTLDRAKKMFFDKLAELDIKVHMLAGNHDTYFKNTNDVNSADLLLREYENINVIDRPQTIHLDYSNTTADILMVPWVCADNYTECMDEIKNTSATICMGHFEISGFAMYRGMKSEEGLSRDIFDRFEYTFSGHYHHKSSSSGIYYLGNPYELTWQDHGDSRGFHILDLEKRHLSFIENTFHLFHKIVYDDVANTIKEIDDIDVDYCKDTYVKVVVINKTNAFLFDKFMNKLYNVNPLDITIVEDYTELTDGLDDDSVDQAEDTLTILNKYVETVEHDSIDNNKLKTLLKEVYVEALNTET
jgi:DNA repair exonuclease SbcCD nuclease subunit